MVSRIGSTPPRMNTACQPYLAISSAEIGPPITPPSGKAAYIRLTSVARVRCGEYSATMAMALDSAPPSPMPIRTRRMNSDLKS